MFNYKSWGYGTQRLLTTKINISFYSKEYKVYTINQFLYLTRKNLLEKRNSILKVFDTNVLTAIIISLIFS